MKTLLLLTTLASLIPPAPAGSRPLAAKDPACITMNTQDLPLDKRKSPLDSLSFTVGGKVAKVCYGRPSLRGRQMLGGDAVPFGKIWRTGANEPTMIHTTGPITLAGIKVPAGSYSLYTVPGKTEWEVVVNRSITQWGEESNYTDAVKKQELGRAKVKPESVSTPVEQFTIRAEPASGDAKALVLEWEKTRVRIPVGA
ncbi:MAG TPA: DUF2911 domain-containing protein [Gemmatimonadales bacterium]|jgi:hypothetical protein|nr:DUF2911 domain-containing protein [Gemmatimonadales bacterium]